MRRWVATFVLAVSPVSASVPFVRGDVNANGAIAIDDALFLLSYLFSPGGAVPPCRDAGDVDDDGNANIADAVALLGYLFVSASPAPAYPFPLCGTDPTDDTTSCVGPVLSCPFASGWSAEIPLGTPKGALCGGVLGGELHTFGGSADWGGAGTDALHQVYDFATGRWTTAAAVPDSNTWGAEGVVADDGRFYMIGGWRNGAVAARRYDPSLDAWESLLDSPLPFQFGHVVARTPGKVHVFGGRGGNRHVVYDLATSTWAVAAPTPAFSFGMAGSAIGDEIYAVGSGSGSLQIYNASSDTWSLGPDLPVHTYAPATAVVGARFIVVSGSTNESGGNICSVQSYDPATQQWTELDPIPTARSWGLAVAWRDQLHVVGGFMVDNRATDAHESTPAP